eukprot:2852085-Rhodomonas_salina.2
MPVVGPSPPALIAPWHTWQLITKVSADRGLVCLGLRLLGYLGIVRAGVLPDAAGEFHDHQVRLVVFVSPLNDGIWLILVGG